MAGKLANDPKALEAFQSKMLAAMQGNAEDGTESARTGLETLAASVQDPSGLMQAMDMLKDPAVVKEVESLVILWTGFFSPPLFFHPTFSPFPSPSSPYAAPDSRRSLHRGLSRADVRSTPYSLDLLQMADPDFQREMKKMAESPMFAEAMQQAQALTVSSLSLPLPLPPSLPSSPPFRVLFS